MLDKLCAFLCSLKMVILSVAFLLASVILHFLKIDIGFDFSILTIIISGIPIMYYGLSSLFLDRKMTASLLITIAMTASIAVNQYFAAAEIAIIMAIGWILEDLTIDRAKKGIKALISLFPKTAKKISDDGKETIIPAEDIQIGDIIRILAGENIPVDGVIEKGETSINQSIITGEFAPVEKNVSDEVYSGTTNITGVIEIKATKQFSDSTAQKMANLVKTAEANKAPTKRIVDKLASFLIPAALLFAIIVYFVTGEILRAVTVLVVFCPCSLVLATPVSIIASIGAASKKGVIVKSGEALEIIGKSSIFAFDKTGTITKGALSVLSVESFSSLNEDEILYYAASGEKMSEHPIGKAITEYALSKNINLANPVDFKPFAGKGVYLKLDNKRIYAGNEKFITDNGIELTDVIKESLNSKRLEGKIVFIVAIDKTPAGLISLSDTIKENAVLMADKLKPFTKTVMLTGDNKMTAEYFARKTGLDSVYSGLLPKDKADLIKKFKDEGNIVTMTGDGVNDAVALKTADVGISMGKFGSDIAIESSDVIITGDELLKIPYLRALSILCIKTIKTNITISMTINILALTLSALGILNPVTGAIVHNFASIAVVLNATFLYDKKVKY